MTGVIELFDRSPSVVRFDDGSVIPASELAAEGRQLAAHIAAQGFVQGDRIVVHLPNGAGSVRLVLAAAVGGFVAVSVNRRYSPTEVDDLIERSGARRVEISGDWRRYDPHTSASGPDAPFLVFTTSGTTSKPKMVLHTQRSVAVHAFDVAATFGYTPAESVLVAMPLCGTFGLASLMGAIAGGSQVVVTDFEVERTLALLNEHDVTALNGSDDMFHRLIESGAELSSVRVGGYARFNTSLDTVVADAERVGATLTGLYGMSEVQALFSLRNPMGSTADRARAGGTLVSPVASYRIIDGELQVRGPSLMAGYLAEGGARIDGELTATHMADGWFRTGDLAEPDDDRTFEYRSRLGDVMRLGGFLVNPTEIEAVISSIPGVIATQVVAVDRPGGARPVAFVIGEVDEADAIAHCRAELAIYKTPVRVVAIDDFPTTDGANGTKIQRSKLRELAGALLTD